MKPTTLDYTIGKIAAEGGKERKESKSETMEENDLQLLLQMSTVKAVKRSEKLIKNLTKVRYWRERIKN